MFDKKAYDNQYCLDHKEKRKETANQWYLDHKEERKEYNRQRCIEHREYAKEYAQLDKEKERKKRWRFDHPKYNRQYNKQYRKQYYKTPEGKATKQRSNAKRRAKEKEIVNTLTSEEWIDILKKYKFKCAYCGREFNLFDKPEKDHVIPISKGGNNTKENVVPACRSCNAKKYNKLIKPPTIL